MLPAGKERHMRAILISIRPEWVAKILNGEKTIEIRKTAPKCDLPVEVYIYCTKSNKYLLDYEFEKDGSNFFVWNMKSNHYPFKGESDHCFNGKVVAKFTLNKIENFINGMNELEREWDGKPDAEYDYFAYEKALEKACLTYEEAEKYCPDQSFYAWHISDLEIFDEPKELDEFKYWKEYPSCKKCPHAEDENDIAVCENRCRELLTVKRASRSWCYVEARE